MIWIVMTVFIVCLLVCYVAFMNLNKRIDEINRQLDEKINTCNAVCNEYIESQKNLEKKVNNVANTVNKLKRDINKMQNALIIFNNGFDGIQSTM